MPFGAWVLESFQMGLADGATEVDQAASTCKVDPYTIDASMLSGSN